MSRRRVLLVAAVLAALVLLPGWAIPNVVGGAFVRVTPVVTPSDAGGPAGVDLVVGGDRVRAASLEISLDVANAYPLPVVLGYRGPAFRAVLSRRGADGRLTEVWSATADDAGPQEGSDSPAGGRPDAYAVAVPPGTTRWPLAVGATALPVAGRLAPGVYQLRTWAYGVPAEPVPLDVDAPPTGP